MAYQTLPSFSITNYKVFDSAKTKSLSRFRKEHMVAVYEFEFYTEDCEGGHWLDDVYYPVKKGACFLAKPGQRLRSEFPYKCCFLNIETEDKALCQVFDRLPSYFQLIDYQQIVDYLHTMVALENPHTIVGKLQLQSYACRIIARMVRYCQNAQFDQRGTVLHQQNLLKVDRYIREHFAEEINVHDLAKMCNLDPTYFHKLYTAAFGMTPAKRILMRRINTAKRGLISDKLTLEELAAQCGFSSQSYFCYRFKQVTGMTPLQYRDAQLTKGMEPEEEKLISQEQRKPLATSGE